MDSEERFRALFQIAYPALYRYSANRGLSRDDADDLVASTLEIVWHRLDDVPSDDPLPWVFAVARNLHRNKRRSDLRRYALTRRIPPPQREPGPGDRDPSDLDPEALREALGKLEEDDQEILRLVAWDGLSPTQAAAVIGCTPVAARTRLHRARNRLASHLDIDPRVQRPRASGQISGAHVHSISQTEAFDV
jgi:RNA polymerase sigma-70 factor (ECF subfamily)